MTTTRKWVVHRCDTADETPIQKAVFLKHGSFGTRLEAEEYADQLDQGYDWCISEVITKHTVETRPYKAVD